MGWEFHPAGQCCSSFRTPIRTKLSQWAPAGGWAGGGGQEKASSALASVPTAWPSLACPRLIPLPQTLSLTLADKSHFQDGLIQFSTDFFCLLGPVTYSSPASTGCHVTAQHRRPYSGSAPAAAAALCLLLAWEGATSCPGVAPQGCPTTAFPAGYGPRSTGVVGVLRKW